MGNLLRAIKPSLSRVLRESRDLRKGIEIEDPQTFNATARVSTVVEATPLLQLAVLLTLPHEREELKHFR